MRRPMERVAAPLRLMGARIVTQDGRPPVQVRWHARAARDRVRTADRQRAGEVRDPAGGAARARLHAPHRACALARSHRAHAAQLSASGAARAVPRLPSRAARRCAATQLDVPADFSSAAFFVVAAAWRPQEPVLHRATSASTRRAPGSSRSCRRMGADIRVHRPPAQAARAARRPRGALERTARHRGTRGTGAAVDR